jgi:phosphoglycolate phosphatase
MRNEQRSTVIIDLDGTLVDSAPDLADALDQLLAERGIEPVGLDITRTLIGHGIPHLVEAGFDFRNVGLREDNRADAVGRFRDLYSANLSKKTRPYPGVEQALREMTNDGWRLVVCTNKLERYARTILGDLGLIGFFDVVAGPDTFGVAKPDPNHMLRLLPNAADPAVVVGDSEVDVATAKSAGLPIIAVNYGYCRVPVETLRPDAIVSSFGDVPAAVKAIGLGFNKPSVTEE